MLKKLISLFVVAVLAVPVWAQINPNTMVNPYTPDADTAALWHLDNGAQFDDASANARDFTNDSGATYTGAGRFGTGVDLAGASDSHIRRTVASPASAWEVLTSDGVTAECWFKADGTQKAYAGLIDAAANHGILLRYNDAQGLQAIFYVDGVGSVALGSDPLSADVWHHAAMVRSKTVGTNELYVDGEMVDDYIIGAGHNLYGSTPGFVHTMKIGGNAMAGGYEFNGMIDEIRISSAAREYVPEPTTLLLLGVGGLLMRRRQSAR